MKSSVFRALLPSLLAAGLVYGTFPISQVQRVTNVPTVPNQFIIEVDTIANIPTKRSFSRVRRNIFLPSSLLTIGCQSLDAVYALLKERSVGFDVTKEFEASGLFVGASITVNSAQVCGAMFSPHYKITNFTQDVAAISKTPGVVAIRPVVRIPPPK